MHNFRKLDVWKNSMKLVKQVYLQVNTFPKTELYGLVSQMKRCSISIPSNIAEGCGRGTDKQLNYHLDVALGSAFELETQITISNELNYLNENVTNMLVENTQEVIKMIIGLKRNINSAK